MYKFQVYNTKSRKYRTVYAGKESGAYARLIQGHGVRRVVVEKEGGRKVLAKIG